ncbi:major facilitator superfamily domain-containing protein [Phaeosphaeriaceae sp. PMI808]|nr:major facilitator superfamily domain-containing protein [Phaeosphaeriaceae sp. PMI808]
MYTRPVCGGFIAQRAGWRWNMWVVFIVASIITIGLIVFNVEACAPILKRKTILLRKELNRPELQNTLTYKDAAKRSPAQILRHGISRPFICPFCSARLLYLLFAIVAVVFIPTYGWAAELTGLTFLGIRVGSFLGIALVARTPDATIIKLAKRNKAVYEPEMRFPVGIFFGFLIPASFFIYGWTTYYKVHWIVLALSLIPSRLGIMGIFAPLQTYMIDCFPQYSALAIVGMTAMRCLFGAVLPLAGPTMYRSLGLGWGDTILGFISIAFIPLPASLFKYGKQVRERWPINV